MLKEKFVAFGVIFLFFAGTGDFYYTSISTHITHLMNSTQEKEKKQKCGKKKENNHNNNK